MKKQKDLIFVCLSCGHEEPKWLSRCPECGECNTLFKIISLCDKVFLSIEEVF
jgi:predicted ATP-dependent serine protease